MNLNHFCVQVIFVIHCPKKFRGRILSIAIGLQIAVLWLDLKYDTVFNSAFKSLSNEYHTTPIIFEKLEWGCYVI